MPQRTLFVDTGAWYALVDKSDRFHRQAVDVYRGVLKRYRHLTTTNLVIAETYVLIRRAIGHQAAMTFLSNVGNSPRIEKVYSDRTLETSAEDLLRQYEDQDFSFTDAVSFAVMTTAEIKEAFAFDRHFSTAGFLMLPAA